MDSSTEKTEHITVLLPAGRLPLNMMAKAHQLAEQFNLDIYLSTLQNLRLLNVPTSAVEEVKAELAALGADFKGKGKFPIPRVCVGAPHCNLGVVDTEEVSRTILHHFRNKETTKPKVKISISACTLGCSGAKTTDISLVATRDGYDIYAGGKAGIAPKVGRRIKRGVTESEMLATLDTLFAFHDSKAGKKMRLFKLLSDPEFPFPEV